MTILKVLTSVGNQLGTRNHPRDRKSEMQWSISIEREHLQVRPTTVKMMKPMFLHVGPVLLFSLPT